MNLIVEFLHHNTVMNDKLMQVCRGLSPDQLAASVDGTYGAIGATLVHIANGQVGYAARFHAVERPEPLVEHPIAELDAVSERMRMGNRLLEEAAQRADEDFVVQVSGDDPVGTWQMPAALLLLQAVNHGTEHRSQIATVLTQLGVQPPDMDGWTYFFEHGHMVPVDPQ